MIIRRAKRDEYDEIWGIIREVIKSEDTYVFPADTPKEEMLGYWCHPDKFTYVALIEDKVAGTFVIQENQPGLGNHVANAGYMTHPEKAGKGIGTAMGEFSLEEARRLGFKSMQFNIVIASNEGAIHLWEKLGFRIIGEIPEAFRAKNSKLINAFIMWKKL